MGKLCRYLILVHTKVTRNNDGNYSKDYMVCYEAKKFRNLKIKNKNKT